MTDHLWAQRDAKRDRILHFCANEELFAPPILPTAILQDIPAAIVEICGEWTWL